MAGYIAEQETDIGRNGEFRASWSVKRKLRV
jgi:hypothetical protein